MQITVNDELPELNARLTSIYQTLNGDLTPLMQDIGALVVRQTEERFDTKTAPDGDPWAELLPSTIRAKGHGQILHDHGELEDSIVSRITRHAVAIGSDDKKAKYHQTGTKNADGSVRMVARPWLGLSEGDKTAINQLLDDFMFGVVNG